MAIRPNDEYPGQVDESDPTGYPYGAAQNINNPGDGLGTPLEKAWLSDLWGFQQALLAAASITPSETPDKVGASDYLDALDALYLRKAGGTVTGPVTFSGDVVFSGTSEVTFNDDVVFDDGVTFNDDVGFLAGALVTFWDDVTFKDVATFEDAVTFEEAIVCEDNLTITGVLWSTGGLTLSGQMSAKAEIYLNDAGRIRQRVTTATDTDESHSVLTTDILWIPGSGITGAHAYTIENDGASAGSTMTVVNRDNATHTLLRENAEAICTIAAGERVLLVYVNDGGLQWLAAE